MNFLKSFLIVIVHSKIQFPQFTDCSDVWADDSAAGGAGVPVEFWHGSLEGGDAEGTVFLWISYMDISQIDFGDSPF